MGEFSWEVLVSDGSVTYTPVYQDTFIFVCKIYICTFILATKIIQSYVFSSSYLLFVIPGCPVELDFCISFSSALTYSGSLIYTIMHVILSVPVPSDIVISPLAMPYSISSFQA